MTRLRPGYPHTKETELAVLALYKQNLENSEICEKLNVNKDYPTKIAKKYGIDRGSGRKSNIRSDLFTAKTPESNYWLGYLVSDGNLNINKKSRTCQISIATIDKEIVEKFKIFCPLTNLHMQTSTLHILHFGSNKIGEEIQKVGITPKKSKTIKLTIPLNNHILRGIFDGDGSVHNKRPSIKITTGSIALGTQIVDYLKKENIFSKLRIRQKTTTYDVWVERKADFKKFFDLLYMDATKNIYMERKYNKFLSTFKLNNINI